MAFGLKELVRAADGARRGTAIQTDASAELLLPRSPAARHRQSAVAPDAARFSPLTAPQRAIVDGFLAEAQPWAMRQARRAYRHLPVELHEQALDAASLALRTGAPSGLDRRTLYADLAERLDEELRRIHVGWCLNQARTTSGPVTTAPTEPAPTPRHPVTSFIEDGLGGLERAVLQLELGAGRDTATARAALRLGPRQYGRHRELGLGKLRGAISGAISGRVCAQHLDSVTLAATGDRHAADALASGPGRCRACAREAGLLQRLLQQRLALAPWPLAIKPAGVIAAKIGALGTLFGGKGAAGGAMGFGGSAAGSGAKIVATLVATAAVASGGISAVEADDAARSTSPAAAGAAPAPAAQRASAPNGARATGATPRSTRNRRRAAAERERPSLQTKTPVPLSASSPAADQSTSEGTSPTPGAGRPSGTVRRTVDDAKKAVDRVTRKLPVKVPPVDRIVPGADGAVDDLTETVDRLLKP